MECNAQSKVGANANSTGINGLEQIIRPFSLPTKDFDDDFLALIVSTHARESTKRFLEKFGRRLKDHTNGVDGYLSSAITNGLGFDAAWDCSFGQVFRAVQGITEASPVVLVAALCLKLSSTGQKGAWQANWGESPVRLRWGSWILPPATEISVCSEGNCATVMTRTGSGSRTQTFRRQGSEWLTDNCDKLHLTASPGPSIALLADAGLTAHEKQSLMPLVPVAEIPQTLTNAYSQAGQILAAAAPQYVPWISRVLRYIAVVNPPAINVMASGTTDWSCGLIHVSLCNKAPALAETLVHEASHQYFHIVQRLGPVDDGSDTKTYYSPVVQAQRPLGRILLAFHAFANVLIFYRALGTLRLLDEESARSANLAETQLELLAQPLANNPALTSVGRGLFRPLADCLARDGSHAN